MSTAKWVWGRSLLLCGLLHFSVVSSTCHTTRESKVLCHLWSKKNEKRQKSHECFSNENKTNLSWNLPIGWKVLALLGNPALWLFNVSKTSFFKHLHLEHRCVCCLSMGHGPNVSHCNHCNRTYTEQPKTCCSQANQVREHRFHPSPRTRTR